MSEMDKRMSTMARKRVGRLVKPTIAEMINARHGTKADNRDAMRNIISGKSNSVVSAVGRTRRLKRKRRSR